MSKRKELSGKALRWAVAKSAARPVTKLAWPEEGEGRGKGRGANVIREVSQADPAAAIMTKFYSEKWKVAEGFYAVK